MGRHLVPGGERHRHSGDRVVVVLARPPANLPDLDILFTVASFLSGIAPNLEFLIVARVFQGIGGGPIIPMSQSIMWEIFSLRQHGLAMSVWGIEIMMGPIFGPTLGGWIADNWSWRWIFYINPPIGLAGCSPSCSSRSPGWSR